MVQELPLPKWGLTMEEGTIVEWLVKPGDHVREGTILASVATDKIDVDWESPLSGVVVKHLAEQGATVGVGEPVLVVDDEAGDTP